MSKMTEAQQALHDAMTIDAKGTATIDKAVFQVASGISKEDEERVMKAKKQLATDTAVALAHKGIEVFKANPELKSVAIAQKTAGGGQVKASVSKSRTFPNPKEPGKEIIGHGVVNYGYSSVGKPSSDVKSLVSSLYEAEFGTK